MNKLDGKSLDIVSENVEKLKELFPEVFSESKIDFEKLENELGKFVDKEQERYNFTWNGKQEAKKIAQTPSTGTLRPCEEESKNWDTTQNLYIEGDNLEVLKLLQKSYHKKVKMIYIDPPYNTGKDFVYKDNFKDNIKNYLELTGQVDSEGNRLSTNSDTNGRYHSDWLSMMYPRLKLARNLLKDDGVIVIHIDENEYVNLEKLLNEIFGEDNNLGTIIWDKRNPKGEVAGIAQQHELISVYAKNKDYFKKHSELKRPKENAKAILKKASTLISKVGEVNETVKQEFKQWLSKQNFSGGEKAYNLLDENGNVYQSVSMAAPDKPETRSHRQLLHPNTQKPCPVPAKGWRFPDKTMDELLANEEIVFGVDENSQPRRKYILQNNLYENLPSLLYFGGSDDALSLPFDNPKPTTVALKLIQSVCNSLNSNDIILDFFSGSATTAHAVMQLNAEDRGERKYICVQIPEPTDEKSEAYKAGYKNICEIGKERIRRAGEKIISDNPDKDLSNLDIGFKVFKLDSSNIKEWDSDFDNLEQNLMDATENIKIDRTSEDLLYEILLKYGLDLTLPIEEIIIDGKKVFVIGFGALVVCLDENITTDTVEAIAKLKEEYETEVMRVVFKDSSFKDAVVKTNAIQILKQYGIDEVVSV
jgi:adenine-specific DNA-methyltransferase